eukprot:TRINITY_DN3886_c0_g1_i4.p1 TRINITY_DN3886_c0_g1~~TRINITY_DN3886_c0_g1_i4.p1  ORF type:complete len:1239 (+),score=189.29 TRINITY_DN3886_c0_g1_i4:1280-4996(+)
MRSCITSSTTDSRMRKPSQSFSQMEVPAGLPKVIPGPPLPPNTEAIDWGPHGCVAYGTGSIVTVLDPQSGRIIQTLEGHRGCVTKVKWAYSSMTSLPHGLNFVWKLASGDSTGMVIVWDVKDGKPVMVQQENPTYQKQILQLHWHPEWHSYLMCLQYPSVMTVWNVRKNEKVWRCEIGDGCFDFEINPFDTTSMALAAEGGWVYFAKNFSKTSAPSSIERKYKVQSSLGQSQTPSDDPSRKSGNRPSMKHLVSKVGELAISSTGSSTKDIPQVSTRTKSKTDLMQLKYSPHFKDIIYMVLSREVLIFDLRIQQAIGNIVLDRARGMFTFILTCPTLSEFIFFLHDDGLISAWRTRNKNSFQYDYITSSDYYKVGKQVLPKSATLGMPPMIGISSSPFSETSFALLSNDGRIHIVKFSEFTPDLSRYTDHKSEPFDTASLFDGRRASEKAQRHVPFKFSLVTSAQSLISPTSCIQVHLSTSSRPSLMAVGSRFGSLQIVNLVSNEVEFEYEITNNRIRQVVWISPYKILLYAYSESDRQYHNMVWIVDIRNGRKQAIRPTTALESSHISLIKVSYTKQYALIYLKDKPLEIWNIQTGEVAHFIHSLSNVVSFEWMTGGSDLPIEFTKGYKERLAVATQGNIHFFGIEQGSAVPIRYPFENSIRASCLAWRENYLVTGDETNNITVWDVMKASKYQTITLRTASVKNLKFCPISKTPTVLIQHGDSDVSVAYLDITGRLFNHSWPREFHTVDIDWGWSCHPVVALQDGGVRLLDSSLRCNSPIRPTWISYPLITPALLPPKQALSLKAYLQHGCKSFGESLAPLPFQPILDLIDEKVMSYLRDPLLTRVDRCLKVAEVFGDIREHRFWTLANYYLDAYKEHPDMNVDPPMPEPSFSAGYLPSPSKQTNYNVTHPISSSPLPGCYNLMRDKQTIYAEGLAIADIHISRRANYDLTKQCVHQNIILGKLERSIQMLMETPSDNKNFLNDMLKACVLAGGISSESFENTVRLVASNLIASNMLDEGIQLLAMLGKSGDACRYLEMNERWEDSAFLGKISLPESQSGDVFRRWAREIWQGNPHKAAMLCLSVGDFFEAITILLSARLYDMAAQLANCCLDMSLVSKEATLMNSVSFFVRESVLGVYGTQGKLTSDLLLRCTMQRYSQTLTQLDYYCAAEHYHQLSGAVEKLPDIDGEVDPNLDIDTDHDLLPSTSSGAQIMLETGFDVQKHSLTPLLIPGDDDN